jgi:hypothetical protein
MQWEYQTVECTREDMIATLNQYGREGWEIVPPLVWGEATITVLLKRLILPGPAHRIETKP